MTQVQVQDLEVCDPQRTRIGWIGTGVMGAAMCGRLLEAGYGVTVHTRTRQKAEPLLQRGALWAESPAEVARDAHVVVTMVGFPQDVREVYLGKDGVLPTARKGTVVVDMTTTEPQLAREIYEAAKAQGVHAVDAPVSGGDVGAREGTLSIMIGGDPAVVDAVRPLFQVLGKNIVYQGPAGAGQHTKMCNQIVIAGTMVGVCESLLYGARAGLDLETMLTSIRRGAAGCWTLDNLAPRILQRNFDPGFFVEHFIKDMGIALKEAERMGLSLPGLALVHQLYLAVKAQGHGKKGTHALVLALEQLAGKSALSQEPVGSQ
ncbi:3-hydroxyisobutyrate dehydrogenase [Desulfacinum hydrothermale DSM 13146]|uniref:3-hydroxyisobutyrate dehydrogenase n=1 Tax=Desulfacinum hydrothermale DSM 13146 TaxID=1121390 RepID=A0A1W1XJR3_9BACT|nr:NAD(P)-dependent oxidoreductase [Desulfacinum hydrothermale]SMC23738.1 3-hydroxyisobutyrate dehydrogenase [Desulfacinum hydrothermale DSM 13146]